MTTSYMPESDAFLFDYDFTKASLTKALNDHSKNRFSLEKEMTARPLEKRESSDGNEGKCSCDADFFCYQE